MTMTTCHYLVETCFWRQAHGTARAIVNNPAQDSPIQKTRKEFVADEPIVAREMAFSHFSSIIDVLYQGLGGKFTTDRQARTDLQPYFDSGDAFEGSASNPDKKFKVTLDMMNGVEIYMVLTDTDAIGTRVKKYCIHGIRYMDYPDRLDRDIINSLESLAHEYCVYETDGYAMRDYKQKLDLQRIGGGQVQILATPFDWEGLMQDFDGRPLVESELLR